MSGMEEAKTRCGFVALVGAPNAGKSTLLNKLVGTKVSIVSPKVQTTRTRVLGICIEDQTQIAFIDTPGIFAPKRRLDRAMVAAAWGGAAEADDVVLLIDASKGITRDAEAIIQRLKETKRKVILALNKVDQVQKPILLDLATKLDAAGVFSDIFMISALKGSGVSDLMTFLTARMPEGPWHYPEDQVSDLPERMLAAEITREKVFLQLKQELPYRITVETEKWEERKDGSIKIDQLLFVQKDGHKQIVLGKGGQQIKRIGEAARRELEEILDCKVHLFLFIKVRDSWEDDPERYRNMGLDFNA